MDSLYSISEETFAKSLIAAVHHDSLILTLSRVMSIVLSSPDIPEALKPHILLRALRLLRDIEQKNNILDLCYAIIVPHPACRQTNLALGELWLLPLEHEWLCHDCGRPLYYFNETRI